MVRVRGAGLVAGPDVDARDAERAGRTRGDEHGSTTMVDPQHAVTVDRVAAAVEAADVVFRVDRAPAGRMAADVGAHDGAEAPMAGVGGAAEAGE